MQFKAGYISDVVSCIIDINRSKIDPYSENGMDELGKINGLIKSASSFDVDFGSVEYNPDFKNIHPVLAVVNNIITRGLPTRAPIFLEKCFERLETDLDTLKMTAILSFIFLCFMFLFSIFVFRFTNKKNSFFHVNNGILCHKKCSTILALVIVKFVNF